MLLPGRKSAHSEVVITHLLLIDATHIYSLMSNPFIRPTIIFGPQLWTGFDVIMH